MSNITIYHNPACGTSRNTLEMIRNSGTEPTIIHYLETPPTRDELVKLIADHPILINRPIVVTPLGTRLCRPSEVVLEILPDAQKGAFSKEDGEKVVDEAGKRLK